jgi:hypothetical protein
VRYANVRFFSSSFTLSFTAFFWGRLFGDICDFMAMRGVVLDRDGGREGAFRHGGRVRAGGWCNVGFATQRDLRSGNGEMGDGFL